MSGERVAFDAVTVNTVEPPRGSVVMRDGLGGTAYQRLWSTGAWHSVIGGAEHGMSWEYFAARARTRAGVDRPKTPDVIIVYGGN